MFKKSSPLKTSQVQTNDLSVLVTRVQKNADQVEKNILRAEDLLAEDTEDGRQGLGLTRRIETADNLTEAETLLKDLFLDVDKIKKLQHPQAGEIELDVSNLHDRWSKDCAKYRELYKQSLNLDLSPRIDWAQVLADKQRLIQGDDYGPTQSDVEKQIAAHNILHKEIETYRSQVDSADLSSVKRQYTKLLEDSLSRKRHLSSLYDYIQRCNKELHYLKDQHDRIRKRDWSDRIMDSTGVRMEYERFKNNGLLTHETEVHNLQSEANGLVSTKHPGSYAITDHNAAVQKEWKHFLSLCVCQEAHLNNVEDYKKYQLDAETISESLKRINSTMEPSLLSKMSNPQILMQLEGEERAVQRNERRLADLRQFCNRVAPLPLRRSTTTKLPVEALCDWSTDKASVKRGERYTLASSPIHENWEVKNNLGDTKVIPGVCFVIPPPDRDAIDRVESLEQDLASLKRRRTSLQASIRAPPTEEVVHVTRTVIVNSAPEDSSKSRDLASRLDRLIADLLKLEKEVLGRLRAPLDAANHTGDLAIRIRDHERAVSTLRNLEAEKASIKREVEPLLSPKPLGPTTSSLPEKLSIATNKIEDINNLTDLYGKKANAVMSLENQIKRVDNTLNGLEHQLAKQTVILDKSSAIEDHTYDLQNIQKDVEARKDEIQKLNRDLELTEQLCGHLQKGFQEYCPDIHRQETEVRRLRNRYANINNQLQQRLTLMQEAANKDQSFQSSVQSLNKFLNNIPNNKIYTRDSETEITSKLNSQKRTVEELRRKSDDVNRIVNLSQELQNILKEYEAITHKYSSSTGDVNTDVTKRYSYTLANAVHTKERDAVKRYNEALAENIQLLDQMRYAKNVVNKNEEIVNRVVVHQQLQQQSQRRELEEVEALKKELTEEISRRIHAENELENYRRRMVSLRSRRGVERVEEKEILQYFRDPKLETDLEILKQRIHEEVLKRTGTHTEIESIKNKIFSLEREVTTIQPKIVTKVFTEYEKDPKLEKEAAWIREEIRKIREEIRLRETEVVQKTTEITFLERKKPTIKERVVKKEVVKLEKDPEMLRAVIVFKDEISNEGIKCKNLNDEIFHTRSQINTLERIIPTVQPKIVIKELKRVEQDPELLRESKILRTSLAEVTQETSVLLKELNSLQLHYSHVETLKPKIEVKETVNEIYRVDHKTETELRRLKNELLEYGRRRVEMENEINLLMVDIKTLRSQKPKVEVKESTHEIVKEERSPEIVRELARLNEQLTRLRTTYNSTLNQLNILRKERDEWKVERSKVETKILTREVVRYENDPLLEKEAERLRKEVNEEVQRRRVVEENVFDLHQKYIILERQKPEEKVIYQEVVHLQKDPKQILEHERLTKRFDEETKSRWAVEVDVQKLRTLVSEKEKSLVHKDDRQKKILVETELRQIRSRIYELETCPPPIEEKIIIEEVVKVERDPKLEKLIYSLRSEIESESNLITTLQRDIRNLKIQVDILVKEKSVERTIYKEVIRVEKDQAVEAERERLRDQLAQIKSARRKQENEIQHFSTKLTRLQTTVKTVSNEESSLITLRDALLKEREDFLRQLKRLETERQEITVTFQYESKLLSERTQTNRQRLIKLESDMQSLEKDILLEKERIHQREATIIELQNTLKKEDHSEKQTRETTKSTRITILDPETGKDMSPYDAYVEGLIDRAQYLHLQTLECSWEEFTNIGPNGETTVLQDRKSGKKYSIQEALKDGRLTQYDLQQYKEGKIPISEFALMVAGEKKVSSYTTTDSVPSSPMKSTSTSTLNSYNSSTLTRRPSYSSNGYLNTTTVVTSGDEMFPISGVLDTTTNSRMSVRSAMTRKLIDADTVQKLLEAQAATGGIVDISKKERFSVHKAAERGLIDQNQMHKLLNAQKAFTGVEDPVTKGRLSVGEASQKGWIPRDNARRYMEAQILTGGLVDPNKAGRMSLETAVSLKMVDKSVASVLEDDSKHLKDLVDPITKKTITYKQAMALCKKDTSTGLLLLPVASTDSTDSPSYSSFQFSH
ncbi:envoplakin [Salminus brasiliensis]|uniref:envoplakin n=1 Tax=Salminus brasiliensis TaxID=930266 RepID=UPI003B8346BE